MNIINWREPVEESGSKGFVDEESTFENLRRKCCKSTQTTTTDGSPGVIFHRFICLDLFIVEFKSRKTFGLLILVGVVWFIT